MLSEVFYNWSTKEHWSQVVQRHLKSMFIECSGIPYISRQLQNVSYLDLVWDRYIAGTLKATARAKPGKEFVIELLLLHTYRKTGKIFCVWTSTNRNSSAFSQRHLLNQLNTKKNLLSQTGYRFFVCQHYRILIYLLHAIMKRLTVVWCCMYNMLPPPNTSAYCWHWCCGIGCDGSWETIAEVQIWLAFGTGKNLAAHKIAASLGLEK